MENRGLFYWFRYLSVVALLSLTALSYHPRYANLVLETESSNPLMKYIYVLLALAFLLHISIKNWFGDTRLKMIFSQVLLLVFTVFMTETIFGENSYFNETKNVIMATVFVLLGYNSMMYRREMVLLILAYTLMVDYSTLSQIFSNWGGFVIADQYMSYGKNTLGVMLASSCIAMALMVTEMKNKYMKIIFLLLMLFTLFLDITIRARASFLTILVLLAYIFYKSQSKIKNKKVFGYVLGITAAFVLIMIFSPSFFNKVWDYVLNSFTQNQSEDLTSGRMSRNIFSVNFIFDHPFFGNLACKETYPMIHNYVLRQLSAFGLIGGLPLMLVYFYLLKSIIKYIYNLGVTSVSVGFVVMLVPFIISLEEPTFPYAPGTGSILPFHLLGYSLYLTNSCNISK